MHSCCQCTIKPDKYHYVKRSSALSLPYLYQFRSEVCYAIQNPHTHHVYTVNKQILFKEFVSTSCTPLNVTILCFSGGACRGVRSPEPLSSPTYKAPINPDKTSFIAFSPYKRAKKKNSPFHTLHIHVIKFSKFKFPHPLIFFLLTYRRVILYITRKLEGPVPDG